MRRLLIRYNLAQRYSGNIGAQFSSPVTLHGKVIIRWVLDGIQGEESSMCNVSSQAGQLMKYVRGYFSLFAAWVGIHTHLSTLMNMKYISSFIIHEEGPSIEDDDKTSFVVH